MYFNVLAFIFVVLLILVFSTCVGCYSVLPYSSDSVFTIQYPYDKDTFATMKSGINTVVAKVTGEEKKEEEKDSAKKVEGFGLMPAPYGVETPIDRFSGLKSDKSCAPSPYSTSTGFLCMDKDTEKLLRTRGGNISGGDSQIGSA